MNSRLATPLDWRLIATAAAVAALLPLFVLATGAPIGDPDIARLATLHLRPDFWTRAALTFVYFPAVIALHYLMQPSADVPRAVYLCGFCLFLAGNTIDLAYRAVQFMTVGGDWGAAWLSASDPRAKAAIAQKIAVFAELAPAITFSFSLLFAAGRLLMGLALWMAGSAPLRIAGAALIVNGLWNSATVLREVPGLTALDALGDFYLWIWLLSIGALGTAAVLTGTREKKLDAPAQPTRLSNIS